MTIRRVLFLLLAMALASTAFGQGVTITSTSPLPSGYSSIPYSFTFTASGIPGGTFTWAALKGTTLPPGLTISPGGVLSGTPTQSGTVTVAVQVIENVNGADISSTGTFSLTLATPSINIATPATLPNGFVSQAYSVTFSATSTPSNGITWIPVGSSLPPGLNFNAGVLSGTPTAPGVYQIPIEAEITGSSFAVTEVFSITIYSGQVAIQTASLPVALSGQSYSTTLTATPSAVTWALNGALPTGLTFNTGSGLLAGTTSAAGSYTLQFTASATNFLSATRTYTLTVAPPLVVSTTSLPSAIEGSPYNSTVTGSGGIPPYQWSLGSGSVPGLSISAQSGNTQNGNITGTPTASGTFLLPVILSDSVGESITQLVQLFVAAPLSVQTTSLPNGTVGVAYSQTLQAGGSQSPFLWSLVQGSGSLPAGLTLASSGTISGTPIAAGTFSFKVQVSDTGGRTATAALSIQIVGGAALTITTASLPGGQLTVAYSQTVAATGGTAPYTWQIVSGTLPASLALNALTGAITGTPTALGQSTFTLQVKDSTPGTPLTAQKAFTITIALTLTITTQTLPGGTVGVAYSQTLVASGGTTPYTWSIASGPLPAGLQLNASSGVISGTPTATGTSSITVMVTDAAAATAQQKLSIVIAAAGTPLSIATGNLSGTVGTAFSQTLAATGGTPPYTFSISSGTLPAGLQLTNGVIGGTPTAAGTASITLKVTDSKQLTATAVVSIAIALPAAPPINITTTTSTPASQPSPAVTLGSPFPVAVTGTLSVSFQSSVGGSPSEVQFVTSSGGSGSVSFSIAAGSTNAVFANAPALMTGTVAGTITLTATLNAGGVNITPTPAPTETIVIAPSAPVIQSVAFSNTGGSLTVTVIGYSTTREMVSGLFTFVPATGSTLSQSAVTVQLGSPFSTWFQSSGSNQYGGQFMLTIPFSVAGDAADVISVNVTLTNTKGTSPSVSPQ